MNLTKHPNIALLALACAGAIGSASAGSAHFIKGPTSSISGPTVTETWKESGLGNGDVNYRTVIVARYCLDDLRVDDVEDDPEDNSVGYGGLPNELGIVELDASVMHGPTRTNRPGGLSWITTP